MYSSLGSLIYVSLERDLVFCSAARQVCSCCHACDLNLDVMYSSLGAKGNSDTISISVRYINLMSEVTYSFFQPNKPFKQTEPPTKQNVLKLIGTLVSLNKVRPHKLCRQRKFGLSILWGQL
uniref:Uncharacterized protein n=1 Tax=Gopherus agassizii TaxID=38772 RepID=A0A452HRV2_9SAUR